MLGSETAETARQAPVSTETVDSNQGVNETVTPLAPSWTEAEKERAAKEAEAKRKREADAARREAVRRNSALLATYTSAQDIDEARSRALADNQKAVKAVELRIEAIKKRRSSYDKELELYKGDNKPPARLQDDIRDAEIDLKAQENLLAAKKKDIDTINARYDQDKQRYLELTGRR